MPLAAGEEFAGYTVLRVLGVGGMGTVYLVQHPRLPRQDALKVLSADLTTDPQYRARLLRERFRRGMPVGLAMQIVAPVASALDYAHQRGLLHRDVKPANILIAD